MGNCAATDFKNDHECPPIRNIGNSMTDFENDNRVELIICDICGQKIVADKFLLHETVCFIQNGPPDQTPKR